MGKSQQNGISKTRKGIGKIQEAEEHISTEKTSEEVYIESDNEKECFNSSNFQDYSQKNSTLLLNNKEVQFDEQKDISDYENEQTNKQKQKVSRKKIQKQSANSKRGGIKKMSNNKNEIQNNQDERLFEVDQQVKIENSENFRKTMESFIRDAFCDELFQQINEILNQQILEQKYVIKHGDVKKFCAFLLLTGQMKMGFITEYYSQLLSINNIISLELFSFIAATLQNNSVMSQFINLLKKLPFSTQINSSQEKKTQQYIQASYLSFYNDYYIDVENKNIQVINDNKPESQIFFSKNSQLKVQNNSFQDSILIENKASFKKQIDNICQKNSIFYTNELQVSNKALQNVLFEMQNKLIKESTQNTQQERYTFYYDPTNLSLQNISLNQINNSYQNSNSDQKSQKGHLISPDDQFLIDQKKILFKNLKQNSIESELLKIYLKKRPLTQINLEQFECFGLRALAEIIYSLCIQAFEKFIYTQNSISILNPNILKQNILEQLFKEFLNSVNQLLINSESQQQIHVDNQQVYQQIQNSKNNQVVIVVKRHSLQKKEHCNFCLVCKHNYENRDQIDNEVITQKSSKKEKQTKKSINKEQINENQDDINKKKKSKYQCIQCTEFYGRSISLCVERCDELFHENPYKYINRIKCNQNINQKDEKIIQQLPKISVNDVLQQIENTQNLIRQVAMKIHCDQLIALKNIYDIIKHQKAKRKNKKVDDIQQLELKINQCQLIQKNEQIDVIQANIFPEISLIKQSKNAHKDEDKAQQQLQNSFTQSNKSNENIKDQDILKKEEPLFEQQLEQMEQEEDKINHENQLMQDLLNQQEEEYKQEKTIKQENIFKEEQLTQNYSVIDSIYNSDPYYVFQKSNQNSQYIEKIKIEGDFPNSIESQKIKTENE